MISRLALALAFAATTVVAQTTYYVSLNGNDGASGTSPESAWRTIGRVNAQPFAPGDRILFQGGHTFNGTLRISNINSTTPGTTTTFSSFGEGRAAINATDDDAVILTNSSQIRIANLRIVGTSLNNRIFNRAGIAGRADGGPISAIVIEDTDISGFSLGGIVFQGSPANAISNISIFSSLIRENGYSGIGFFAEAVNAFRTVNILDNDIVLTSGFPSSDGRPVEGSGTGVVLAGVTSVSLAGNAIHETGPFASGSYAVTVTHSRNVIIWGNEIWGQRTASADGGGAIDIAGDVQNAQIIYNYTHANDGAAVRICGCVGNVSQILAAHNISENDAGRHTDGVLTIIGDRLVESVYLYRNTIFAGAIGEANTAAAVRIRSLRQEGLFAIEIASNIFMTDHRTSMIDVGNSPDVEQVRFAGNIYHAADGITAFTWRTDTFENLMQWVDVTEQEIFDGRLVGREVDPMLTAPGRGGTIHPRSLSSLSAYRLRPGSPAIDTSVEPIPPATFQLFDQGRRDFYGYAIPVNARGDVGAHELSPPAPPLFVVPRNVTLAPGQSMAVELIVDDPDGADGTILSLLTGADYATVTPVVNNEATLVIRAGVNPGAPVVITVRARDASGLTSDQTITLTITGDAPRSRRRASRH